MANRNWASGGKIYSMHASPVMITATALIGASGAVTSYVGSAVQSVAKQAGVGTYRVIMQPNTNFSRMFFAAGSMQSPVSGLSGVVAVEISFNPNGSLDDSAIPYIEVKCLDVAGALVNPASGSKLNVMIMASNSSVIIDGE